ncbi:DgyrCDS1954 [Dimorphilus gyrociliatus]|uniref:DgyrCDS1954 n=1 Tax=Dimorphilus gyrociliatus TaxID=2664684 RepID=A0A7I8VBY2_9ANNE|nr:DgyrCDS1954 [Dimorphilus gyrociliatus]
MNGIRVESFGEPSVLKYVKDLKKPAPSGKQILIRMKAAGVNPLETYIRSGGFPSLPKLPYTPGTDGAGIIEDIGREVTKFKKGDRVYTTNSITGTYAEYSLVEEADVHLLHKNLSFADGASLFIPYYTAFRAVFTKGMGIAGKHILVHGASGAVGIAVCQMAAAGGLIVVGTAGTDEGIDMVKKNGASHCFNHRKAGYIDQAVAITGGKGFDIIVEMLANTNLNADLSVAARKGKVLIIGCRGTVDNFDPFPMMLKEIQVEGILVFGATSKQMVECADFLYSGMEKGWLKPVIDVPYDLSDAEEAHKEVIDHKKGTNGKIVLNIK